MAVHAAHVNETFNQRSNGENEKHPVKGGPSPHDLAVRFLRVTAASSSGVFEHVASKKLRVSRTRTKRSSERRNDFDRHATPVRTRQMKVDLHIDVINNCRSPPPATPSLRWFWLDPFVRPLGERDFSPLAFSTGYRSVYYTHVRTRVRACVW